MKIFWSWQDDFSPKFCRHFIKDALSKAIDVLSEQLDLEDAERPELDHDTKGEQGMVDIVQSIFDKVSEADLFVADLTPITKTKQGKAIPNPNVLIELGWAGQKPGWKRIIGIINTANVWKIDDLPFDINKRRVISYELSDSADKKTQTEEKKNLVKKLTMAIKDDLVLHLENEVASKEITGVAANPDDPSIWKNPGIEFSHRYNLSEGGQEKIKVPTCPRGYIRVIPYGWKNGPPDIRTMEHISHKFSVYAESSGTAGSGNHGDCEYGFIRYWYAGVPKDQLVETKNIAFFFEESGEFWVLHGTAIYSNENKRYLALESLFAGWKKTISTSFVFFDEYNALPIRKVEVGLFGIKGVILPGISNFDSRSSFKNSFKYFHQDKNWGEQDQFWFLFRAYNEVLKLFNNPNIEESGFKVLWDKW